MAGSCANPNIGVVTLGPFPHRFPPPWTVEDIGAAYVVKDSAGQQLAYVYFEDEPGRRRDETRREPDPFSGLCLPVARSAA